MEEEVKSVVDKKIIETLIQMINYDTSDTTKAYIIKTYMEDMIMVFSPPRPCEK
jgi:hypothetical protein